MPPVDPDSTPPIICIFYRVMSAMAIAIAVFGLLAIVAAMRAAIRPGGPMVIKAMVVAVCSICGGAMLVGARGLWLSARPHADATMRRWRSIYFLLWSAGAVIMAALWYLS